jgi:hypothetical protein
MNRDQKIRDDFLGITRDDYGGGVASFSGLSFEKLNWLLDRDFVDLEERQNDSPSIFEFQSFMIAHPCFTALGYVVDGSRSDYRVSIEGLSGNTTDVNEMLEFSKFNRLADEFICDKGNQYSWWD